MPITSDTANSVQSGEVSGDEPGQGDAERHLHELHADQERTAREPVGEDTGGDRQQQQRPELREHQQADERRRLGSMLDVRRQREVLHPRADVGQEQPDPDQPEVAVRERGAGGAWPVRVGGEMRSLDRQVKLAPCVSVLSVGIGRCEAIPTDSCG